MWGSFGVCAALLPGSPSAGLDRVCGRFLIHFFAISRHCHLEFSGGCGGHVSGCVLALGVTMGCPSFPDGYAFSICIRGEELGCGGGTYLGGGRATQCLI